MQRNIATIIIVLLSTVPRTGRLECTRLYMSVVGTRNDIIIYWLYVRDHALLIPVPGNWYDKTWVSPMPRSARVLLALRSLAYVSPHEPPLPFHSAGDAIHAVSAG